LEGVIASCQVSFVHSGALNRDPLFLGAKVNQYNLNDLKPVFEVVPHDGGLYIGARRNAEEGHHYWRITPWVMPSFTMVPPRGDHPIHGHFWVPIDDHNNWAWSFDYHPTRDLTTTEVQAMEDGHGIHVRYVPGTFRPLQNKDNDYLMDRAAQKAGITYSGVEGISMQDASLQESMGPVQDRTRENLVSTDNGIIMARQRLMKAAKALLEKDEAPPGIAPETQRIRSVAIVLREGQPFKEAARDALRAEPNKKHASV
ncbi:MAG: rieske 2Fe-2S region, partial [Ramlibacter sp.]|nr:rieske 2Fe-2S region [Ramlibacter sp.]